MDRKTRQFTPSSLEHIFPPDEYSATRLQFEVLGQLGYPAKIDPVTPEEVTYAYTARPSDVRLRWGIARFREEGWARPVVTDPDFERHCLPCVRCKITDYSQIIPWRADHPVQWVQHVDDGDVACLDDVRRRYAEAGRAPIDYCDMPEEFNFGSILDACILAACSRQKQRQERLYPFDQTQLSPMTNTLYHELNGTLQPVQPLQLSMIIQDYYERHAATYPGFAAFRRPGGAADVGG